MNKSTIDKYGILIPSFNCTKVNNNCKYNQHVKLYWDYGQFHLTVTSKLLPKFNTLNSITIEDVKKHSEVIADITGYYIPFEVLMYSPLYWLDMKTDVQNTTGYSNDKIYSVLREKCYKNTTRHEIVTFAKKLGFEHSILITSSSKSVNDSFTIYNKIDEIKTTRYFNQDYYNNFTEAFYEQNANLFRFERRIQKNRNIKKAFHLEELMHITLSDVYNSDVDVVAEKVQKLFM